MNCQTCNSDRISNVVAHSKDSSSISYRGHETDGYFQNIDNVCSGDDMDITVCLECGQLQGNWPVEDPKIEQECISCDEYSEFAFDDNVCPLCGEAAYMPYFAEPKEHGGICEVVVGVGKCKLLIPFEIEGLPHRPIGHEMIVQWTSNVHIGVTYMGNELRLERGIEAELI